MFSFLRKPTLSTTARQSTRTSRLAKAWLGVNSLRTRASSPNPATHTPGEVQFPDATRRLVGTGYRAGLATDLLNPKVGVFFVSFLPGFVPAGHAVGPNSLLFGAIFVV